ncbi:nuclear pore complex protein NUP43 [Mercurialis annua]|uniref:nuclear pore complex protein NUP43 n=1 Tax=Mercurialis annua TaxID=3986 RepID=UPI00215F0CB3|nr:nuclear pore complex protein NUP43 [Mercurialis annua]
MAITAAVAFPQQQTEIQKLPQFKYIDSIRWLPALSPFQKSIITASFNTDTNTPSLETHSFNPSETLNLTLLSSWIPSSRISCLTSTSSITAAATFSGSLHIFPTASQESLNPKISVAGNRDFHVGPIRGVDVMEGGSEVVSVGEDGRVNLVRVLDGGKMGNGNFKSVYDGNGLVSYSAVKWASSTEFVTGGVGFGIQWWDLRRPNSAVAHFKGIWDQGRTTSGIIHSIDIHPSRKHTCLAGGSSGTVFAWDIRWPQQSIVLSGIGTNDTTQSLSESDVWEVKYDCYTKSSSSNISSSRILPAMICSEDGILAVIEQGEEPIELLAEPCAINSFDIDRQNPSDVICSLEWESIAILSRP